MRLRQSDLTDRLQRLHPGPDCGLVCYRLYVTRSTSGFLVVDSLTRQVLCFKNAAQAAAFVMERNRVLARTLAAQV